MTKTPETAIDTLDMGDLCQLTLTNRHLRGGVTKIFPNGAKQKEQIDVLLSGLAGYSVTEISRKGSRIMSILSGILMCGVGFFVCNLSVMVGASICVTGGILVWVGLVTKDIAIFELNVMGNKTPIPIRIRDVARVREFLTKIQNAKIAYEEENG